MTPKLKNHLKNKWPIRAYVIAESLAIHPARLSSLANGKAAPNPFEIKKLTKYFDMSESQLFSPETWTL